MLTKNFQAYKQHINKSIQTFFNEFKREFFGNLPLTNLDSEYRHFGKTLNLSSKRTYHHCPPTNFKRSPVFKIHSKRIDYSKYIMSLEIEPYSHKLRDFTILPYS